MIELYHDSKERKDYFAQWHQQNKEERNKKASANYWLTRAIDPKTHMLHRTRARAKKLGLEHDIDQDDFEIPDTCPVLGIPLIRGEEKKKGPLQTSPSLDRINPNRGYVKGNVCVISHRANTLKNDASIEEIEAVLAYMKRMSLT